MRSDPPLIIVGGGLAGSLTALALARLRPDLPLLLIERGQHFGGNHIWSFFDADVDPAHRWLVDPAVARSWPSYDVFFPKRSRTLGTGYNSLRSSLLDRQVRQSLRPDRYRLGTATHELAPDHVILGDGERLEALAVLDARGPAGLGGLDLAWQKFVGEEVRTTAPHGLERPIVMDARVDQTDGYRFVYCLPFDADRLLIEDTYYREDPGLDRSQLSTRIRNYADSRGWAIAESLHLEQGVLPVALGGDFDCFWPAGDCVGRLGLRGGFFHPTTGYSLPDAVRTAILVTQTGDWPSLGSSLRRHAATLWRQRAFYRLLNRMLFRATEPHLRYRVLEHFYRIDEKAVARFYAARTTLADRLHILSGRPPVPIGRALKALWT